MKKLLLSFSILLFVLSVSYAAPAAQKKSVPKEVKTSVLQTESIQYEKSPLNKLARGVMNTATFWAEIPASVCSVSKEKDPLSGFTLGAVQGTFNAVLRGITGMFDALTFVIPPYDKPLMEPEYSFKAADEQIKEYLW
jgi:putative exosortase-associated protein (TIGR04073 family)